MYGFLRRRSTEVGSNRTAAGTVLAVDLLKIGLVFTSRPLLPPTLCFSSLFSAAVSLVSRCLSLYGQRVSLRHSAIQDSDSSEYPCIPSNAFNFVYFRLYKCLSRLGINKYLSMNTLYAGTQLVAIALAPSCLLILFRSLSLELRWPNSHMFSIRSAVYHFWRGPSEASCRP